MKLFWQESIECGVETAQHRVEKENFTLNFYILNSIARHFVFIHSELFRGCYFILSFFFLTWNQEYLYKV